MGKTTEQKAIDLLKRCFNHLNESESYEEAVSTEDLSLEIKMFLIENNKNDFIKCIDCGFNACENHSKCIRKQAK